MTEEIDLKIVYITDLDDGNYESYIPDIFLSIHYMKEISGMSFNCLAKLSTLNKQTIYKYFNDHTGCFTDNPLINNPKFETVKKLNDLVGKVIAGSTKGNDKIH